MAYVCIWYAYDCMHIVYICMYIQIATNNWILGNKKNEIILNNRKTIVQEKFISLRLFKEITQEKTETAQIKVSISIF